MLFLFAVRVIVWGFTTHHVADMDEINIFVTGLQSALYWAVIPGLMYLAFEPYMRKSAPERVVSWSRLLAGDWLDPIVGRDLLIGAATGSIFAIIALMLNLIPVWFGQPPSAPNIDPAHLSGISGFPAYFLDDLSTYLFIAFMLSFLILFSGLLLRRKSLGVAAVLLIVMVVMVLAGIGDENTMWETIASLFLAVTLVLLAARFGVIAVISLSLRVDAMDPKNGIPLGTWYAGGYVAYALVLLVLAIFGFYTSTAGQKLLHGKLLGDGN